MSGMPSKFSDILYTQYKLVPNKFPTFSSMKIKIKNFQFGRIGQSESESVEYVERRLLSTQPSGREYQRSLERLCCAIAKAHDLPSGAEDRKHVQGEGKM